MILQTLDVNLSFEKCIFPFEKPAIDIHDIAWIEIRNINFDISIDLELHINKGGELKETILLKDKNSLVIKKEPDWTSIYFVGNDLPSETEVSFLVSLFKNN